MLTTDELRTLRSMLRDCDNACRSLESYVDEDQQKLKWREAVAWQGAEVTDHLKELVEHIDCLTTLE